MVSVTLTGWGGHQGKQVCVLKETGLSVTVNTATGTAACDCRHSISNVRKVGITFPSKSPEVFGFKPKKTMVDHFYSM